MLEAKLRKLLKQPK